MTAKELIEILEACAHNTGVSLDELHIDVWGAEWYSDAIVGYRISNDGRAVILECDY